MLILFGNNVCSSDKIICTHAAISIQFIDLSYLSYDLWLSKRSNELTEVNVLD